MKIILQFLFIKKYTPKSLHFFSPTEYEIKIILYNFKKIEL
jgi:hypothetical protein